MGVCVSGPCILVQLDKQAVEDDASLHHLDDRMALLGHPIGIYDLVYFS